MRPAAWRARVRPTISRPKPIAQTYSEAKARLPPFRGHKPTFERRCKIDLNDRFRNSPGPFSSVPRSACVLFVDAGAGPFPYRLVPLFEIAGSPFRFWGYGSIYPDSGDPRHE